MKRCLHVLLAMQALLMIATVSDAIAAGEMGDPMRPPGAWGATGAETVKPDELQAILIVGRRRYATINGIEQTVGDTVGDSRIVAISETEVSLRNHEGLRILSLHPDIEKKVRIYSNKPISAQTRTLREGSK